MRTPLLVGIVVTVHCVAVGSAILIQGCRTTRLPKAEPVVVTETADVQKPAPVPQIVPPPVVESPKIESAVSLDTTTYVVASGDTLSVIAYKYGLKMPEIMALNTMTNPNKLRVGQKLMLPGKINIAAPKRQIKKKQKVEESAVVKIEGAAEYTVEPGDSLSVIAAKYGTTIAAIKKANGLTSSALKAGQKLMVPGAEKKEQEEAVETPATPTDIPAPDAMAPAPATVPADATMSAPAAGASVPEPAAAPVSAPALEPVPAAVQAAQSAIDVPAAPMKAATTQTYTVEPNDDLVKVSKMWGVSVDELKKLNGLADTTLKPGQVLRIPIVE
ncbi:MAG: hypothetical protein A2283_21810 [Lentisphaerae bacterium RIFOXYA12_FULL_48_11]|nr:MAG: hypothetical protein A2283_21810 [Lentisphaerae bacterium RIFOXYA12_FULL_48_11]